MALAHRCLVDEVPQHRLAAWRDQDLLGVRAASWTRGEPFSDLAELEI